MTIARTNRLSLRRFERTDAAFVLALLNDPSYHANIGDRGIRSVSEAEEYVQTVLQVSYLENGFGLYLVEGRGAGAIGMCGLVNRQGLDGVDLGYAFLPSFWGQGYAREACLAVMSHARRELDLSELLAIVAKHNHASAALLARLGFHRIGDFDHVDSGECLDLYRCNLSHSDE